MKQSLLLIEQLKKIMKSNGMSYAQLGQGLDLSESSVKRIFSKKSFTLERLDEICELLGVEFYDLAKSLKNNDFEELKSFSFEQEQALAQDERLFTIFYLLATGSSVHQISKDYEFTELEKTKALLQLDHLKLIQYHSDKKIKLLFSSNIRWQKNGPLSKLYESKIKNEFLQSDFSGANESFGFISGFFTDQDLKILNGKIKKLVAEINSISEINSKSSKINKIWLLFAYRPWVFSPISKRSRKRNSQSNTRV